jgi:thiol-disulfide isomerase/thioredoxin
MKKIVIGSLVLASVVVLSGCGLIRTAPEDAMMRKEEWAEMKKDSAMMPEQREVMEKNDTMMQKDETMSDGMMKKDAPQVQGYTTYSAESVDSALASGKKVALFFHATWCPSCKVLDKTLSAETVPSDVVVFKVDYDSSTELKKKYGVTGQHTIVTLDASKNKVKLERGAQDIADITALF